MNFWTCILLVFSLAQSTFSVGILYPQQSESREVLSLDGLWKFYLNPNESSEFPTTETEWIQMPVPSSYNDITVNSTIRDHVGWAWYKRTFFAPKHWSTEKQTVFVRFGSVHYTALVWINGKKACEHYGGHLPFQADITHSLLYGGQNLIMVAVNNTLTLTTIPQGTVQHMNNTNKYPPGYTEFQHAFDFFNYAGIHRPVYIYTTPQVYIDDITIITDINGTEGIIKYNIEFQSIEDILTEPQCTVVVFDKNGSKVTSIKGLTGKIHIFNANFWWPYLFSSNPGYRYTLEIHLNYGTGEDIYRLPVGIRKISWNSTTLLINSEPMYLRGFGKHEDSNIRGKGLDYPLMIRDYNLITWLGANAYRTSHYPYAEEILEMADDIGIMIVDESPACTIDYFTDELLEQHKKVMKELVARDKNRPSVIMWSLSNEPRSYKNQSGEYFRELASLMKALDPSRPVTFVTSSSVNEDKAVEYMDVVCVNRYPAWYSDCGHTELIKRQVIHELTQWHQKFDKPVLVTEYGAGSVDGMHMLPSSMWTEDYQVITLKEHFKAFDYLRKQGFLIGEMIWNFADFATPQEFARPGGCKKGLFTRERQPKMAAHITRWRYWTLAQSINNVTLPNDFLFESV
ncbi:hypothetical protein L9F63_005460 [Diploptera punctata]|uniref:Beta-glucuronidase n=1 Tax=Diploptera punctata TaxID=6984 RepID=A0AAD7ZCT0_DIPPU|nr:hypothetical protein L9F63_005460 [Diploptera punctata]